MKKRTVVIGLAGALLATFAVPASAHGGEVVGGAIVGGAIGAAVGGPPGAAVGAVIGSMIGADASYHNHYGYYGYGPYRAPPPAYYPPAPGYYNPAPGYYQRAPTYYDPRAYRASLGLRRPPVAIDRFGIRELWLV